MWLQFDWGDGPASPDGPQDVVVLRLAGLVAVPGGDPDLGPDAADADRLPGRDAAAARWGADVCVDRQREDRHRRARRRGAGAAPEVVAAGRHYGVHGATVCRPTRESKGGVGGDGADRQGRPGADRGEPASPTTARSPSWPRRVEAFCEQVNARAHRVTGAGAGRDARRGAGARLHVLPGRAAHGGVRADPRVVNEDPTVSVRVGALLGPAPVTSITGVVPGGRRRAGRHRRSTATAARSRSPGTALSTPGDPQHRATRTTRDHPAARASPATATPTAHQPAEAAFLAIGDGAARLAGRGRRGRAVAGAGQDGRAPSSSPNVLGPARSTRRWAWPRRPAGSPMATSPRSWTTSPAGDPGDLRARRRGPLGLQPGTAGWARFGAMTRHDHSDTRP